MSCDNFCETGGEMAGHCVADVVKKIVKAQREAVRAGEDTCLTSCERSIEDLLNEFEPNRRRLRHNTIPFILYCKKSCKPFIGSGIIRSNSRRSFTCIESPVFRVKNFVRGSDHCAVLELLKPVRTNYGPGPASESGDSDGLDANKLLFSESEYGGCQVCDFFRGKKINNFQATGICITVDLNCFCGITCLDPITPLQAPQRALEY